MIGGVLEIGSEGLHLSKDRGFVTASLEGQEQARLPLDDVTVLVMSGYGQSLSVNLIRALMERGAVLLTLGGNHHPQGLTLPLYEHYDGAAILRDQIALPLPRQKRLWQQLVIAKILFQQACLARACPGHDKIPDIGVLAKRVKSGDPDNMEAQAARIYWPALLGPDFRRNDGTPGVNGMLNYGYAILRAAMARAVVAAGLNPAMGLHHQSRGNMFALVDDLMEPFRPLVDRQVQRLANAGMQELDRDGKADLVAILQQDMLTEKGASPVINVMNRLAQSLVICLRDKAAKLHLPELPDPNGTLFDGV